MMAREQLHFTIGPVQGFVAAARRTRDLWAGSWLLSHLAEQAVRAVEESSGARLVLPARAAPSGAASDLEPIGTTPNRLVAEGAETELVKVAQSAASALRSRWRAIADLVWQDFVASVVERGNFGETEQIWHRQVDSFWEIAWVIGPSEAAAWRKTWRSVPAHEEPGFRCVLFPHLQELSGCVGRGKPDEFERFWSRIRERAGVGEYDLEEGEALSAIGLIKRLYPRLDEFRGLGVGSWPSVAWIAAVPWIHHVLEHHEPASRRYVESLRATLGGRIFESTAAAGRLFGGRPGSFACLDGQLFFARGIETHVKEAGRNPGGAMLEEQAAESLRSAHRSLREAVQSEPSPWFAALAMDGDRMGRLLDILGSDHHAKLSAALCSFASTVDETVSQHKGRTVYAGGDDVLALLPAESAVACAAALRRGYFDAFQRELGVKHEAMAALGISAGLLFADWKVPLRQVIQEARRLLEDVAKDSTGRDSLAIGVWLASGKACEWSAPWGSMGVTPGDGSGLLSDLLRCGDSGAVSSSFVYKVRSSLVGVFDSPHDEPGTYSLLPTGIDLEGMLLADLVRVHGTDQRAEHERTAGALARLSRPHVRRLDDEGAATIGSDATNFGFDGLRLARFLARLGSGQGHDGERP